VVAAVVTLKGRPANLATIPELVASVGGWLGHYDGYRGVFVLADQDDQEAKTSRPTSRTSRLITLWDSAEDELAARESRGELRDQLMAMVGVELVAFDVYDVPGHDYIPD